MKLIFAFTFILFLFGFDISICLAQDSEPIKKEWLDKDVNNLKILSELTPIETSSFEKIEKIIKSDESDSGVGFGTRTPYFSIYGGYTTLNVRGLVFKGSIIQIKVSVSSGLSWSKVKPFIIEGWKQNSQSEFIESENEIYYERTFPDVLELYKTSVGNELGQMKAVNVPSELKEEYELLTDPFENSIIANGGCGYGGSMPEGKIAINAIVEAKRIDLLENILKGYNPGGRIYAALALLKMEKRGVKIGTDVKTTISKLKSLDVSIATCAGCIVSYRTAKQILSTPDEL